MPERKFLVISAHPDPASFNAAIRNTISSVLERSRQPFEMIDLYANAYNPVLSLQELKGEISEETKAYQEKIKRADVILFLFPVWWFRAPAILEGFFDKVFIPGFAYRFKKIIGKFGMPVPLLREKRVLAIITHGAPALPVKILYVNAVKYRFLLGFLSFCFYLWRCRIIQLWAVPFVSQKKRVRYLKKVERVLENYLS